jgi:hypothetical protein
LEQRLQAWALKKVSQPVQKPRTDPRRFDGDPVGYAQQVLQVEHIWDQQKAVARALLEPPYKVMVKAGHSLGKTFLASWIVNYWYDTYNPGVAITTAPTKRDVEDLLWKEVRLQRARVGLDDDFIGPSAPEMRSSPDHYAKGFTARKGESFQGRHDARMLFVFDEAIGVAANYWNTVRTMFKPEHGHAWLVIFNPTDTTTQAYLEEQYGDWKVFSLSSMEHPNIQAHLEGKPSPIPAAVSKGQVDSWVRDWCTPVKREELKTTDFMWTVDGLPEIKFWRPGPDFESRCLGRWPSQGTYGVWSDGLWCSIEGEDLGYREDDLPQIGCDVARFGDDMTEIHVRRGATSLSHEAHSGWPITRTADRLTELAQQMAKEVSSERRDAGGILPDVFARNIILRVDDDGVGGGVSDILNSRGLSVRAVRAGTTAIDPVRYPNKRSELWFLIAEKALAGLVSFGRLPADVRRKLKIQAMAPQWWLDPAGRRVVEPKDDTKAKIGRSPDGMDALNLAYYEVSGLGEMEVVEPDRETYMETNVSREYMGGWSR